MMYSILMWIADTDSAFSWYDALVLIIISSDDFCWTWMLAYFVD